MEYLLKGQENGIFLKCLSNLHNSSIYISMLRFSLNITFCASISNLDQSIFHDNLSLKSHLHHALISIMFGKRIDIKGEITIFSYSKCLLFLIWNRDINLYVVFSIYIRRIVFYTWKFDTRILFKIFMVWCAYLI